MYYIHICTYTSYTSVRQFSYMYIYRQVYCTLPVVFAYLLAFPVVCCLLREAPSMSAKTVAVTGAPQIDLATLPENAKTVLDRDGPEAVYVGPIS